MSSIRDHAVLWFLVLTFVPTWIIEGSMIVLGLPVTGPNATVGQILIAAVMFIPGLAAVITTRMILHEDWSTLGIRIGSWKPYLFTAGLLPLCFLGIAAMTTVAGLADPDWTLQGMIQLFAGAVPASEMPPPMLIIVVLAVSTTLFVPFVNGIPAFGEELGWRGFLLPRLLPLGKPLMHLVLGVIWGAWHLPLLIGGFGFAEFSWWNIPLFFLMTTGLGTFINELTLRYRSTVLAAWIHGVFNSQKLGVWAVLYPTMPTVLGGYAGVVGVVVWLALGAVVMTISSRTKR